MGTSESVVEELALMMTEEEFREFQTKRRILLKPDSPAQAQQAAPKRQKYGNKRVEIGGIEIQEVSSCWTSRRRKIIFYARLRQRWLSALSTTCARLYIEPLFFPVALICKVQKQEADQKNQLCSAMQTPFRKPVNYL